MSKNTPQRKLLLLLLLLSASVFILWSCRPDDGGSEKQQPAAPPPPQKIDVSVTPFDVFPERANFGFSLRFSAPVVQKGSRQEYPPNLTIQPPVLGATSWSSDSELTFIPNAPLPAETSYEVDLGGLHLPAGQSLSRTRITVTLPRPKLQIVKCALPETSQDPITKKFGVSIYLNYSLNGYFFGTSEQREKLRTLVREHIKLKRILGGVEESVPVTVDLQDQSMTIDVTATEMLRPGKDGTFHFGLDAGLPATGGKTFSGDGCEVKFLDTDWRTELSSKLADSEAKKVPLPALPVSFLGATSRGKERLSIRFVDPVKKAVEVPHKRATGEIIEKGMTIEPAVEGQWKVSPSTSEVEFEPAKPWTPGQQYQVTLDPKEFPELQLAGTTTKFIAYYLEGSFRHIDSGTVPEDPARRVVATTLAFNYPVSAEKLEKLLSFTIAEKGRKGSGQPGRFSVEQGADFNLVVVRSEPLQLKDYPLDLAFQLKGAVTSTLGGKASTLSLARSFELPSRFDIFSIAGADLSVAKSSSEELQRILTVTTSEDVEEQLVTNGAELLLLPDCKDKAVKKFCENEEAFSHEGQVTTEVEKLSEKLPLTFVSRSEGSGESTFSYSFQSHGGRQVFFRLPKGLTSKLGFPLQRNFRSVMHLKDYPKRLNIMLDGSLLSVSGTRRLGILAQNVKRIRYRLSRVKATDLHHLVYVTSGSFKQPDLNTTFTYDDMAQPFEFREELPETPSGKPAYTSVDFSRFLGTEKELPRGLFFLEVNDGEERKKDEAAASSEEGAEYTGEEGGESTYCDNESGSCDEAGEALTQDSRLVLLTDLGLVVKRSLAGSDRVYVASFRKGEPVTGAQVRLIARNGSTLFSAMSDKNGEVSFPRAEDFVREKQAVLYVAEKDGDLTFIPYERRDRAVNFSRFDVGGVVNNEEPDALRALVFTDRGIYRPGEKVNFGLTVRNRDFSPLSAELPLTVRILDPRGETIAKDVVRFPKLGVAEYFFETSESRTTGTYRCELVIPARGTLPDRVLGQVEFRVEEFEPDRLQISANLGAADTGTFKKLDGLNGMVTLKNLFGAPAAGNTVKASVAIDPWSGYLAAFPGYNFRPMLEYQSRTDLRLDLGELQTDEKGEVSFPITVPDVSGVVLEGVFSAEGFEKESGRSVGTNSRALLTDLQMLVGVHSEDALDYIEKSAVRRIDLQALNLKGEKVASGPLQVSVEREEYRNVLVKQPNGVFKYESAKKLVPVSKDTVEIPADGKNIELNTQEPGTFLMGIRDAGGVLLNQLRYSVMGEGNETIKINRNANLDLVLNQPGYSPGDSIEVSIKGPYAGFGLISIEREKVLSTSWFRMEGTTTVQKVKLPPGVVGNAYVTVLLARAWDSREIYLPPLSYASVPLKIAETEYSLPPQLDAPKVVKPGGQTVFHYSTKEPGAVLLYAVDEGILQFAKYRAPEPLKALLPKRALEVETRTALDLIMPDYSVVQSVLSPGGDADADLAKFQNPFKKRNRPPVAYWSGIRRVEAGKGEFAVDVPDYFDGSVKVFAFFVGEKRVGFSQGRTEIRGDFVLKPNMPTFVAPGDAFDLTVEVTNTKDTEQKTTVALETAHLEVVGDNRQTLTLKPNIGQVARFRVKATNDLGEASARFSAEADKANRSVGETLSIRPASPLMRTVKFGAYDPEDPKGNPEKTVSGLREMYSQYREVKAGISHSPGLFVDTLSQFMEGYPYGCSEQLTSKGFIWLLLSSYSEDEGMKQKLRKNLEKTFRQLAARMNGSGGIGYWRRAEEADGFVTVYADHLVIDSAEKGFQAPAWFSDGVKSFLKEKSQENQFGIDGLFTQAYAIYLRARLGEVVTSELNSMVGRLEAVKGEEWKGSAVSWLVASTYSLLHMGENAKKYTVDAVETNFGALPFPLNNRTLNAGLINYLKARHFGGTLNKDVTFSLLNRLDGESPDSLSAASLALGLMASSVEEASGNKLSIRGKSGDLPLTGNLIHVANVPAENSSLTFLGPKERHYFYSLVESGFDAKPALQGSRTQGVLLARDIVDKDGKSVSKLKLGESYRVVLRLQSDKSVANFAVQDLLPAGFEPDLEALKDRVSVGHESNAWSCENVDVRDDRLLLFGTLPSEASVFSYPVKPTVKGQFVWPGIYGEAMYDSRIYAWEKSTSIEVE